MRDVSTLGVDLITKVGVAIARCWHMPVIPNHPLRLLYLCSSGRIMTTLSFKAAFKVFIQPFGHYICKIFAEHLHILDSLAPQSKMFDNAILLILYGTSAGQEPAYPIDTPTHVSSGLGECSIPIKGSLRSVQEPVDICYMRGRTSQLYTKPL